MSDSEALAEAFCGDKDAVALAFHLARVADVWDNLIDRDKPVTPEDINDAFWLALVEIPRNQFYLRHMGHLQPLIAHSIFNYQIANAYETGAVPGEEAGVLAHVLRYSVADVIVHMAYLAGGRDWALKVGPRLRMLAQKDTLANFLAEMEAKHANGG